MNIELKDCRTCRFRHECSNPKKSPQFVCTKYGRDKNVQFEHIFNMDFQSMDPEEKAIADQIISDDNDFAQYMADADAISMSRQEHMAQAFSSVEMPEARNFYEFSGKAFLDQPLYPKQFAIATALLAEYCPDCSPKGLWLSKEHIEHDFPVDYDMANVYNDFVLLENGICPVCHTTKPQFIKAGKLRHYNELAMCAGQRSGKSLFQSLLMAYVIHKLVKMEQPSKIFGLARNTNTSGTLVSITSVKAIENLFREMKKLIELDAPWFVEYHKLLRKQELAAGYKVHDIMASKMFYTHRSFRMYPSGPNWGSLRGDTRLFGVIDEIGVFVDNPKADAKQVYTSINNSLLTMQGVFNRLVKEEKYPNILREFGIYISSPRFRDDMIMTLVNNGREFDRTLSIHLPTWKMNPTLPEGDPAYEKMKTEDPEGFDCNIGVEPPYTDSAYIINPERYAALFQNNNVLGNYSYRDTAYGRYAVFNQDLPSSDHPHVIGMDGGVAKNSFVIVLARLSKQDDIPEVVGMVEVAPDAAAKIRINISELFDHIIMPVIKAFNVVRVYADRWESNKILQDIEKLTMDPYTKKPMCDGIQHSLKHKPISDFNFVLQNVLDRERYPTFPCLENGKTPSDILEKQQDIPKSFQYEPANHFLFQLATVRQTPITIDKGAGRNYTDDLFRAVWIALRFLYHPPEAKYLISRKNDFLYKHSAAQKRPWVVTKKSSSGSFNKPFDYNKMTKQMTKEAKIFQTSRDGGIKRGNVQTLVTRPSKRVEAPKKITYEDYYNKRAKR